tara:strand:+ start:1673 stop:1954 length:282 start_codon:yes stop_codon:yes gene_type:complete
MNTIRQISFETTIEGVTLNVVANYDSARPDSHKIISCVFGNMWVPEANWPKDLYARVHAEGCSQDYDMWRERRDAIDEDHAYDMSLERDDCDD